MKKRLCYYLHIFQHWLRSGRRSGFESLDWPIRTKGVKTFLTWLVNQSIQSSDKAQRMRKSLPQRSMPVPRVCEPGRRYFSPSVPFHSASSSEFLFELSEKMVRFGGIIKLLNKYSRVKSPTFSSLKEIWQELFDHVKRWQNRSLCPHYHWILLTAVGFT